MSSELDINANDDNYSKSSSQHSISQDYSAIQVANETFLTKIALLPHKIPAFGLICALIGVTMFSLASLIVKLITQLHPVEILIFRCAIQLVPYLIITLIKPYPIFGVGGHRLDLCLRCISGTVSLITLYTAFRLMPLSDATTIYLSSPLFVTILAFVLLKERITAVQAVTGVVTIAGVCILSRPDFIFGTDSGANGQTSDKNRTIGIILAISAAMSSAYSLINLRKLKTTPVPVVVMWYSLAVVVIGSAILPLVGQWTLPPDLHTWLLLLAIGVAGILNQFFQTTAFKYEKAGPISVTRSFNIVLCFIWDLIIFSETVYWTSIVGACLITACVVIIALNKCYEENPQKFSHCCRSLFCCCRSESEESLQS